MELLIGAIYTVFNPVSIFLILIGIIVGVIFGAIPGLTAITGVTLLLPLTFTMSPELGMALLLGVWVGGISGSFIAAVLLGIPGSPSSIATCFDGHPMCKKGKPEKALIICIIASFIGTFFSIIIATFISPLISRLALSFGPWEYFSLGITALTFVAALSEGNMVKGLAAGFFGLALSTIGMAPIDGARRFTLGTVSLTGGVNILALILGLYAIKQIIVDTFLGIKRIERVSLQFSGYRQLFASLEFFANIWNIIRSFFIGLWIGFLPGMGSGLSNLVSYSQARNSSKHPERFGTGCAEGLYASEVSNNASIGGSIIPMLTLGIPGDSVAAILIGGLVVHGIQPGPLLFTRNADLVYTIFAIVGVAAILTLLLQLIGIRVFPYILRIPYPYMYASLIVMSFIGAFSSNNFYFDCYIMLAFAVIGILMDVGGFPTTPMVLGFILGPMIELNLRRGLTYSEGDFSVFFTRPLSAMLLVFALASIVIPILKKRLKKTTN